jgi:hypothetical protein
MGDREHGPRATDGTIGPMDDPSTAAAREALDRASSFRVTYLAVVAFVFLYLFSVKAVETYLQVHFERVVAASIRNGDPSQPVESWIRTRLMENVNESSWVRIWEARVSVTVIGKDTQTFLYIDGSTPVLGVPNDAAALYRQRERLLPARAVVTASVPHTSLLSNAIVVFYASLLFTGLFAYNRHIVTLENRMIDDALAQRDLAARRTAQIESEIAAVRERARSLEPDERENREEVERLNVERKELERKLAELTSREQELRGKAQLAVHLEQEGQALEELLEEASNDLESKDSEIRALESSLKRAIKASGSQGGREKESELLAKRFRVLYPNLAVDDRAIEDIVALRDESNKLRVEECLKRLSDEAENISLRRKVGGLPNHLSIYEIGFAGKRRIYYMKGKDRRIRVLVIGAKNSQDTDLVYLSKIPKSDVAV